MGPGRRAAVRAWPGAESTWRRRPVAAHVGDRSKRRCGDADDSWSACGDSRRRRRHASEDRILTCPITVPPATRQPRPQLHLRASRTIRRSRCPTGPIPSKLAIASPRAWTSRATSCRRRSLARSLASDRARSPGRRRIRPRRWLRYSKQERCRRAKRRTLKVRPESGLDDYCAAAARGSGAQGCNQSLGLGCAAFARPENRERVFRTFAPGNQVGSDEARRVADGLVEPAAETGPGQCARPA